MALIKSLSGDQRLLWLPSVINSNEHHHYNINRWEPGHGGNKTTYHLLWLLSSWNTRSGKEGRIKPNSESVTHATKIVPRPQFQSALNWRQSGFTKKTDKLRQAGRRPGECIVLSLDYWNKDDYKRFKTRSIHMIIRWTKTKQTKTLIWYDNTKRANFGGKSLFKRQNYS